MRRSRSGAGEQATLYVIAGSHACRTSMLMLERKRIAHRVVELPTGPHGLIVRLHGFAGHRRPIRSVDGRTHRSLAMLDRIGTVPALRFRSELLQSNRRIARFLDRVQPQPPLLPAERERRAAVEEVERWGDEVFQMAARRLALAGAAHGLDTLYERGNRGRLGALLASGEPRRIMSARIASRIAFRVNAQAERELLEQLPAMLERIDAWVAEGTLGGAQPNVADFTIAPSLALLCYRLDLRSEIEARPAVALLERILPEPPALATAAAR